MNRYAKVYLYTYIYIYIERERERERERKSGKRDLIFVDVETAELLLLPFSGDGERARDELVQQPSHHFL